jgi:hypothetical protein
MLQLEHVYFEPWKGPHYEDSGLWGRKVLVVSESHYDTWSDNPPAPETKHELSRNFTNQCVQEVVDGAVGARFWNGVRNRLGGAEHENQSSAVFWNKVACYCFIQSQVSGRAGTRPTAAQWAAAPAILREALAILRPDRAVFFGDEVWWHVPPRDGKLTGIDVVGRRLPLPLEFFTLEDGKRVYVTQTAHPRSSKFIRALARPLCEFVTRDHMANDEPG